jgi:hypothetical protein
MMTKIVGQTWDYLYSSARYRVGIVEEEKVLSKYAPLNAITDGKKFLDLTLKKAERPKKK